VRIENRVAVVTGGSTGIGRATALLFGREGARVVVADYHEKGGRETVRLLEESGSRGLFVPTDVSNPVQVNAMVEKTLQSYGRIDILFNNAGVLFMGTVLDTGLEDWRRVMDINLTGTYLCSRAVLPHMIEGGGGSIINMTSSTGAHDAAAGIAAYVASKGGVALLTRCMAIDHAEQNVRVNALAPGPTDTDMLRDNLTAAQLEAFQNSFPMRRLGRPEELAAAALFLASDEASFVTGAIIAVDGGQTAQV
jgi:NAD(P)-dependent dehydrogenase (short-subunit alcohol dehydrogenase family)